MSIVITGNPGVGKHTIAQEIAKKMKLSIIDVNQIARDLGLSEEIYDDEIAEISDVLDERISDRVVIVGHLAPYVLKKDLVKVMIVLRKSPYELISIYKDRGYTNEKIMENAGSEILGVIINDAIKRFPEKTFQINTTAKSISSTVADTIKVITHRDGDEKVDWLELVRENNDLKKFFAH